MELQCESNKRPQNLLFPTRKKNSESHKGLWFAKEEEEEKEGGDEKKECVRETFPQNQVADQHVAPSLGKASVKEWKQEGNMSLGTTNAERRHIVQIELGNLGPAILLSYYPTELQDSSSASRFKWGWSTFGDKLSTLRFIL